MIWIIGLIPILLYVIKNHEFPESISSLVYMMGGTLWTLWIWTLTGLTMPKLLNVLPEEWKFIGFIGLGCLGFVGAMPLIPDEKNTLHNVLGIATGIFTQVAVLILWPSLLWCWIIFLVLGWRKPVFVSEMICWVTLVSCL